MIPPGLGDMVANHEATSGMGALRPAPTAYAYPPQTIASCAAAAHAAGWSVRVADGAKTEMARFVSEVAGAASDVLAVQVSVGTAETDVTFLRMLRLALGHSPRPHILLLGSSAGQASAGWVDEPLIDVVLIGEPEASIADALDRLHENRLAGNVLAHDVTPGAYSATGLIENLDALPFPAWDRVPWQPYGFVSLLSSRGCGAGCRFCAYTLTQGDHSRSQSVGRTLDEWTWISHDIRPPHLTVRDPVFAHDRDRVVALCEGIAGRGLSLGWACESRPEHFDRELIHLMKAAGCATIKIGMESGDPAFLAQIGRVSHAEETQSYLAQIGRVAEWCREAGVRCRVFVMAGLPGQSAASLDATVSALRRVAPSASIHPNVYRAYDGVALSGPSQPVSPFVLDTLRTGNHPSPPVWRRVVRGLRRRVGAALLRRRVGAVLLRRRVGAALRGRPSGENRGVGRPHRGAPTDATDRFVGAALRGRPDADLRAPTEATGAQVAYPLAGSRVFLTGGNGFVGGHVARALVERGVEVVALVRPNSGAGALADLPVRIVHGDFSEPASWSALLRDCRVCFHVAALYAGPDQAAQMNAVNVRGTGALLAACAAAGVVRFVHTSTIGTVGRPLDPGALPDESTPFNLWEQASHYVRSKYLGELVARSWNGAGLEVVIVKPTAPVGAGDARPTATGRRILAALQGQAGSYPAGGVNHAPVRDIAAGHLLAAERGQAGATYILGHREGNLSHADFLGLVSQGADTAPLHAPAPRTGVGFPDALTANPQRAVSELGMPQTDLAAAFAEAVAWYRERWTKEEGRLRSENGEVMHAGIA